MPPEWPHQSSVPTPPHRGTIQDPVYFRGGTGPRIKFSVSISLRLRFSLKAGKTQAGDLHPAQTGLEGKAPEVPSGRELLGLDRQAGRYPHAHCPTRSARGSRGWSPRPWRGSNTIWTWHLGTWFRRHGGVGVFRSPGPGCPGRWWSLLLWRYSRPAWIRSCAACCR